MNFTIIFVIFAYRDKLIKGIENMEVMGIICILMGLLEFWIAEGLYREARTDLPPFKSQESKKLGNFCFTIGIITSLTGVLFIIGNFTII